MQKIQRIQRPKGTQDILPVDSGLWRTLEQTAFTLFEQAGYHEIRPPMLEAAELFERSVGEETDVVSKEMYTFEKGERLLSLRPEGTAGVVRAFIENGLSREPKPVKLYYSGPMFRYERPQAGRQRQFHQIGLELFGLETPAADAEVIALAMTLFKRLSISDLSLQVNNIGTLADRNRFKEDLKAALKNVLNQLCENCQRRYHTNPLRMLDCKEHGCQALFSAEPVATLIETDFTDTEGQAYFKQVTDVLEALGIAYTRNYRLVRGLDYYSRTVFEITSSQLGAQNTVCGGGRYDGLVDMLGGPPTPAVGWALGVERVLSLLKPVVSVEPDYYLVSDDVAAAMVLAETLREQGASVEVDLSGKAFGKQLATADKRKAKAALILGETERTEGLVTIKNLQTGEQTQSSIKNGQFVLNK